MSGTKMLLTAQSCLGVLGLQGGGLEDPLCDQKNSEVRQLAQSTRALLAQTVYRL